MNVSNKTYHIKETPYFAEGNRIVGNFTSANQQFHEISIDEHEGDLEIWYLNRNAPSDSVLAYSNGEWEIEYRYITFGNNVDLSASDFQTLTWAYDEYIPTRTLYITHNGVRELGKWNGMIKGSFAFQGAVYPFDNREAWQIPEITLDGSIVSTDKIDGVTKYKVYSNGTYLGFIDEDGVWHGEVQPEPSGFTLSVKLNEYDNVFTRGDVRYEIYINDETTPRNLTSDIDFTEVEKFKLKCIFVSGTTDFSTALFNEANTTKIVSMSQLITDGTVPSSYNTWDIGEYSMSSAGGEIETITYNLTQNSTLRISVKED